MALNLFWNPLRSYTAIKNSENVNVRAEIDDDNLIDSSDDQVSSLWAKLKGTFFMFSGYLGNPGHAQRYSVIGGSIDDEESIDVLRNVSGTNHMGVYDYLTFGIPYAIEAFFRGNWLNNRHHQYICQAIFTIIPIVPVLATIRNGIALIATIASLFPVFGIHIGDCAYSAWKTDPLEKQKEEDQKNIDAFLTSYKALSQLFKTTKYLPSVEKSQFYQAACEHHKAASIMTLKYDRDLDSKLFKKENKLYTKYSETVIAQTFGRSI